MIKKIILMLFISLMVVGVVNAVDYYVDPAGSDDTGIGSLELPWQTIQYAIDNAIADDIINVAAGTYEETVTVNKEVSIIGAGNTATIIQPTENSQGMLITADNVLIKDLKIVTSGESEDTNFAIEVQGTNGVSIENNILETTGKGGHGIYVSTSASAGLNIANNMITIGGQATGIYTSHLSPAHSGWTISGNTISAPNAGVNIELYDVNDVTVSGNTFEISGSVSFVYSSELSDASGLILTDNTFSGNGDAAWPGVIPTVWIESDFINWDGDSVVDDVTISGNTFNDWTNTAILIGEDSDCCSDVNGVVINQNKFLKTSPESALRSYTITGVDAENNWWGTDVKTEVTALVTGTVDYEPWCSDSTCETFLSDVDNDGYNSDVDCDDADGAVNPGAEENLDNEIDDNCNGAVDEELDALQIFYSSTWASTVKAALDWLFNRAEQDTEGVNIYLHQGWNTFKLPWFVLTGTAQNTVVADVLEGDYSVTHVLENIDGNYNYLAYYDGTEWQTYVPDDVDATTFTEFPTSATQEDFDFHIYMTTGGRLIIE